MNNKFKLFFLISIAFSISGAFMKLNQISGYNFLLAIGIIATLIFIIIGITEVNKSKKISDSAKIMWSIGFVAFNFFTGLFYLISGRKRII